MDNTGGLYAFISTWMTICNNEDYGIHGVTLEKDLVVFSRETQQGLHFNAGQPVDLHCYSAFVPGGVWKNWLQSSG